MRDTNGTSIWAPLAEHRAPRKYAPGQLIYLQGTEADRFYYLVCGQARSYISSSTGEERLLTIHQDGDLMGEASFFDQCPRVSSAAAVTECDIVSVDRERLDRIFQAHPELAQPMLRYLARTVRLLSAQVDHMSFLRADQRVARYLLSLPPEQGELRCTHEEIGTAVGVSRVTVSRILGQLSRQGILSTGYHSIRLLDPAALAALAEDA